jgi:hypothetical protein|nr:MAG TPA: hypothetical protein [Caudoviricetes sp.]
MEKQPRIPPFRERAAYRASFVLGFVIFLPQGLGAKWLTDPLISLFDGIGVRLHVEGGEDGSLLACTLSGKFGWVGPRFRKHKLNCFLRGYWFPMPGTPDLMPRGR